MWIVYSTIYYIVEYFGEILFDRFDWERRCAFDVDDQAKYGVRAPHTKRHAVTSSSRALLWNWECILHYPMHMFQTSTYYTCILHFQTHTYILIVIKWLPLSLKFRQNVSDSRACTRASDTWNLSKNLAPAKSHRTHRTPAMLVLHWRAVETHEKALRVRAWVCTLGCVTTCACANDACTWCCWPILSRRGAYSSLGNVVCTNLNSRTVGASLRQKRARAHSANCDLYKSCVCCVFLCSARRCAFEWELVYGYG